MKNKSPCYNCKKRVVGCHSNCSDYQEWKKQNDKRKRDKYLDDEYTGYISDLRSAEKKEWR